MGSFKVSLLVVAEVIDDVEHKIPPRGSHREREEEACEAHGPRHPRRARARDVPPRGGVEACLARACVRACVSVDRTLIGRERGGEREERE